MPSISGWVQTPVNINMEESPGQKRLIFFNVSFNGATWGTGVPVLERIKGSTLKAETLGFLEDKLKEIAENFERAFGQSCAFQKFRALQKKSNQTPLEAYINLYSSPANMGRYMDGQPRDSEKSVEIYMRDIARWGPIDGIISLSYDTATPWTGMLGYSIPKEEDSPPVILGRIANGEGRVKGYSESGLVLSESQKGQGFGKDGLVALLVHAWLFSKLEFPVNGQPVTRFTATISPENEKAQRLIREINSSLQEKVITIQNPTPDFKPYGLNAPRDLYGINTIDIERILGLVVSQDKITINGKSVPEFLNLKYFYISSLPLPIQTVKRHPCLSYSQQNIRILPGFSIKETEPVEQIIFLHIPKTAGTNLDAIADIMSQRQKKFHYQRLGVPRVEGKSPNLITKNWIGGLKQLEDNPDLLGNVNTPFFLTGHFPYGLHQYFLQSSKYVTLIRHPVQRELSDANFAYQRGYIKKRDFNNYLKDRMIDNPQVRLIAGKEYVGIPCTEETFEKAKENIERDFLLVAPFEEVDTFIQFLASIQGWGSCAYAPMQITKKKVKEGNDTGLIDSLEDKHKWDLKLYEWIKTRFSRWKAEENFTPKSLSPDELIITLKPDYLTNRNSIFMSVSDIDSYNQKHEKDLFLEQEQSLIGLSPKK